MAEEKPINPSTPNTPQPASTPGQRPEKELTPPTKMPEHDAKGTPVNPATKSK